MFNMEGGKIFSQQYLALNLSYYVLQKIQNLLTNKDFMPKNNYK